MIRHLITLTCFWMTSIASFATQTEADRLYYTENYEEAISAYEAQLEDGINADIFYNLGNSYYRMGKTPEAILNYLKALKMEPQHEQAQENLQFCMNKVGVVMAEDNEMFYATMIKSLMRSINANDWGTLAVVSFALFVVFLILYFTLRKPLYKKIYFFSASLSLVGTIVMNIFAYVNKQAFNEVKYLVSMQPTPVYETASASSKAINTLPAGSVLKLNEEFNDQWFNITLPDGKEVWCEGQFIEKVALTTEKK